MLTLAVLIRSMGDLIWARLSPDKEESGSTTVDTTEKVQPNIVLVTLTDEQQKSEALPPLEMSGGRSGRTARKRGKKEVDLKHLESQVLGLKLRDEPRAGPSHGSSASTSQGFTPRKGKTDNFPFFSDQETVEHIRRSKVMFIMRGLPGSGKTTLVRKICQVYPDAITCSADDFFLQPDGSYRFNRSRLSSAHEACQSKAKRACEQDSHIIVIDNTNVKMWEMNKYAEMANRFGCIVITVQPRTHWKSNPVELAKRNKHGVDAETIRQRLSQFDEGIPYFFGWFLNEASSDYVRRQANQLFKDCQRTSADFSHFISTFSFKPGGARGTSNLDAIYDHGPTHTGPLHCTSFFSNRGRIASSSAYHNQPAIQAAMGQVHTLEIIGLLFTTHTAGLRVRLNDNLLTLWGKDDQEGRNGRSESFGQTKRRRTSRFRPVVGVGSRAHMTLGFTSGTKAVQTGLDLIRVVELEEAHYSDESWDVNDGVLRCYMGQYWVLYLNQPIPAKAIFSGRY